MTDGSADSVPDGGIQPSALTLIRDTLASLTELTSW